ncbi:hypothetical protein [Streptomyces camelliae]|uniref:Uncharacterized protein n=1 Tax=Streptomyces camelliae TaxID=3004093 RepID=A0ABY7PEW7_9ACTN|nr:hypothetical protein [Streptomyces sp. HUAS 2-6]WBO68715.1 hypothetical protein O1G22_40890 [Streptomyces sp. HUAS 2-6]
MYARIHLCSLLLAAVAFAAPVLHLTGGEGPRVAAAARLAVPAHDSGWGG